MWTSDVHATTLVSNQVCRFRSIGEDGDVIVLHGPRAGAGNLQRFTTGANATGYTLSRVTIGGNGNRHSGGFTVDVCRTASSDRPTNPCVNLSLGSGGKYSDADMTFNAPARTTLAANTEFSIRIDLSAISGKPYIAYTDPMMRTGVEDSGRQAGFSIANTMECGAWGTWDRQRTSIVGISLTIPTTCLQRDSYGPPRIKVEDTVNPNMRMRRSENPGPTLEKATAVLTP